MLNFYRPFFMPCFGSHFENGRHFENFENTELSGINSGHHNLPTNEISLKSNNVEFVRYCGDHFENGDR